MRSWRPPCPFSAGPDVALPSTVQQRGLCLMTIEFLTRFPAAECVVTSPSLEFWDFLFDQFPKTLFHAFCCPLDDTPRPNVIRHASRFDSQLAARFGARGAPYSLLFTVEDMETQMALYLHGKPAAALLLVTQPAQEYLDGELIYPVYCSPSSGLCGLVPWPGQARCASYDGYYSAMLEFHAGTRAPGMGYDRAAEDSILAAHARGFSGVGDSGSAALMAEVTRSGLPRLQQEDVIFWEPQQQDAAGPDKKQLDINAADVEALLLALMPTQQQIRPNV